MINNNNNDSDNNSDNNSNNNSNNNRITSSHQGIIEKKSTSVVERCPVS